MRLLPRHTRRALRPEGRQQQCSAWASCRWRAASAACPVGDQLSACAVALLLPEGSEVLQMAATCIVVPYDEL